MSRRFALLLVGVSLSACAKDDPRPAPCQPAPGAVVVDSVLLAFLSQARSAHHVADAREASGDKAMALRALQSLVAAPHPSRKTPEVAEVLADTRARIADLQSQLGQFEEADAAIAAGLEHAPTSSYFRGHLFEVRGAVEERREKALRARGDGQEADRARDRALVAYEEAMRIQAKVIEDSVGRAAPAPATSK